MQLIFNSTFKDKLIEIIKINKINLREADIFFLSSINPKINKKIREKTKTKSLIIEVKPKIFNEESFLKTVKKTK